MPMVDGALNQAGMTLRDVDLLAAVVGPGSFTGVRIGVSAAMGLFSGRTVAPVNGLNALHAQVQSFPGLVCPMLDARAGQVYCALYADGARIAPDRAIRLDELLSEIERMRRPCLFVGDGASAHQETLRALSCARIGAPHEMGLHAASAALLALRHPETHIPAEQLRPLYLRAPQAERQRAAKEEAAHG